MKSKPITFRVHPENKSLYAVVNIWPSKRAMYAHKPINRNHLASCTGQDLLRVSPNGDTRKLGLFAEVNFIRRALGIGVVSHEFTHAGFCWAERRGLPLEHIKQAAQLVGNVLADDSIEEQFCYAVGEMCRQFTQRCYDLGLYKETVVSR